MRTWMSRWSPCRRVARNEPRPDARRRLRTRPAGHGGQSVAAVIACERRPDAHAVAAHGARAEGAIVPVFALEREAVSTGALQHEAVLVAQRDPLEFQAEPSCAGPADAARHGIHATQDLPRGVPLVQLVDAFARHRCARDTGDQRQHRGRECAGAPRRPDIVALATECAGRTCFRRRHAHWIPGRSERAPARSGNAEAIRGVGAESEARLDDGPPAPARKRRAPGASTRVVPRGHCIRIRACGSPSCSRPSSCCRHGPRCSTWCRRPGW